jgi:dienelactone hydrolase
MKTETFEYKDGATVLEGYAVFDDKGPKRPGILVVPDWMGVSKFSNKRAEMLAELGYNVFVADIYGKGVRPTSMEACAAEAGKYQKDRPLMRQRAKAALAILMKTPGTDTTKIGSIGYCFGGTTILELARDGANVQATCAFHANLNTPDASHAKNIKGKVLALHGADDPVVPDTEVLAFEKEMRDAKVDWQLVAYGNAVHSFTNWNIPPDTKGPAVYNEKADKRSWVAMQDFFKEAFA